MKIRTGIIFNDKDIQLLDDFRELIAALDNEGITHIHDIYNDCEIDLYKIDDAVTGLRNMAMDNEVVCYEREV